MKRLTIVLLFAAALCSTASAYQAPSDDTGPFIIVDPAPAPPLAQANIYWYYYWLYNLIGPNGRLYLLP